MLLRGVSPTQSTTFVLETIERWGIDETNFLRVGASGYLDHYPVDPINRQHFIIFDATIGVLLDFLVFEFSTEIKSHDSIKELMAHVQRFPGPRIVHRVYCIKRKGLESFSVGPEHYIVDDPTLITRFQKSMTSVCDRSRGNRTNMLGFSQICHDVCEKKPHCKKEDIIEDLAARDRVWWWDDPKALPPSPHGENSNHG